MRELLGKCRLLVLSANSTNEFTKEARNNLLKDIEAELAKPEHEPEPVAWKHGMILVNDATLKAPGVAIDKSHWTPLYTHPPAQKKQVLLSDHEIRKAADAAGTWTGYSFARAIEQAIMNR